MEQWWKLPGSCRFLDSVVDATADGQCVALAMPVYAPPGIALAIKTLLESREMHARILMAPEDEGISPCEWLFTTLVHDTAPGAIRTAANLAVSDALAGTVFIVEVSSSVTSLWCELLSQYQATMRSLPLLQRGILVVVLPGVKVEQLPSPEAALCIRRYQSKARLHETRLLASQWQTHGSENPLREELNLALLADLCLWDPMLCRAMVKLQLRDLLDPLPFMKEWAVEHGWHELKVPHDALDPEAQRLGLSGPWCERVAWHSGILALRGLSRELERRVWKAQVSVLFPFIEERRMDWIEETRHLIELPFTTDYGYVITDCRDLEIGHLHYLLKLRRYSLTITTMREVEWLKRARHRLAHLQVLDYAFLSEQGSCLLES